MLILATDPGVKGALCLLDTDLPDRLVDYWPMPTQLVQKAAAKKPSPEVSIPGIVVLFQTIQMTYAVDAFVLEKVGGMPRQSASSAFRFGAGYGALRAAGYMSGYRMIEVPPSTWKTKLKVPKDKKASVVTACDAFPGSAPMIRKAASFVRLGGLNDEGGCAEAALLALYAARHVLNLSV